MTKITRTEVTCTACGQRVVIEWVNGELTDREQGHDPQCGRAPA